MFTNKETTENLKDRHYRTPDGKAYKVFGLAFHLETGERLLMLREVGTKFNWIIPYRRINDRCLVDGKPHNLFEPAPDLDEYNVYGVQTVKKGEELPIWTGSMTTYSGDLPGDLRPNGPALPRGNENDVERKWSSGSFGHPNRNGRYKP